jgi:predicted Zn finger-like uncharacterized protein
MAITVTCPSCSASFPVDPAKIPEGGVNARCSSCSDVFRVEKPVEVEPLPTLEELARTPRAAASPVPPPIPEAPPAAPVDDWFAEIDDAPEVEVPPLPTFDDPPSDEPAADFSEPDLPASPEPTARELEPFPSADPFSEPAPFEKAAPSDEPPPKTPDLATSFVVPSSPEPSAPEPVFVEPEPPAEAADAAGPAVQGFTFGKRDPTDKAKRLARVLVSDMIMYNAERHQSALASGTLVQDFEEEIEKSWKEYVDQVGDDLANGVGRQFWTDALNDILAKGKQVF